MEKNNEKEYIPFVINRTLSYFSDTIFYANEMNINASMDNRLQYDFLLCAVREKKRFTKWIKPETEKILESVKLYFGYSDQKAREAVKLLTEEQIEIIKEKTKIGGK